MLVEMVHPEKATGMIYLQLPGQTTPYTDAPIFAQTSGYLKKWYFDIGTKVKAGEVLAEILGHTHHRAGPDYGRDGRRDRQCRAADHRPGSARQSDLLDFTTQLPSTTDSQYSVRWGLPPHCWCALSGARRDALPRVRRCMSRRLPFFCFCYSTLALSELRPFPLASTFPHCAVFGRAAPDRARSASLPSCGSAYSKHQNPGLHL
jgi:hypothetical protein